MVVKNRDIIYEKNIAKISLISFVIPSTLFCNVCCYNSEACCKEAQSLDDDTVIINYGYAKFLKNDETKKSVVAFDSKEGIELFHTSGFKKAFFLLAPRYAP